MRTRAMTGSKELEEIILKSQWCHVGMADAAGMPYVLPMNFGYRDGILYLHGGQEGKKIDILRINPHVCINFSVDQKLRFQDESVACSYSMKYRSVLCYGKVEFFEESDDKVSALDIIMKQYAEREFRYNAPSLREVKVMRVRVERFEGRGFII